MGKVLWQEGGVMAICESCLKEIGPPDGSVTICQSCWEHEEQEKAERLELRLKNKMAEGGVMDSESESTTNLCGFCNGQAIGDGKLIGGSDGWPYVRVCEKHKGNVIDFRLFPSQSPSED